MILLNQTVFVSLHHLKKLYVADTGVGGNDIKVWDVDEASIKNGKQFASMKMDGFDKVGTQMESVQQT